LKKLYTFKIAPPATDNPRDLDSAGRRGPLDRTDTQARKGMIHQKSKPRKATSEGFLLLALMLSVLVTVMSLLMARHPAAGVFEPIRAEASE
jgi:hypothetical protein